MWLLKRPSHLEDEGQTNQVDEVLNINLADRGHFNKNTTAHWVYICMCVFVRSIYFLKIKVWSGFTEQTFPTKWLVQTSTWDAAVRHAGNCEDLWGGGLWKFQSLVLILLFSPACGQNWQHDSATSSKTAISKRCRGGMPGSSQQPGVSTDAKPGKKHHPVWLMYTFTEHLIRNTCMSTHSCNCLIGQSCGSSA